MMDVQIASNPEEMDKNQKKLSLIYDVRAYYGYQKLRIMLSNMIGIKADEEGIKDRIVNLPKQEILMHFNRMKEVKKIEDLLADNLKQDVKYWPIWNQFLKDVKGVGHVISSVIISQVDIEKATTVSKLHRYSGLNVIDGKREKLVKGEKAHFNKFLKKTLMGTLAKSFLMCKGHYSTLYYKSQ